MERLIRSATFPAIDQHKFASVSYGHGDTFLAFDDVLDEVGALARSCRDSHKSPEYMIVTVKGFIEVKLAQARLSRPRTAISQAERHRVVGYAIDAFYNR